ncbi:glycosyltransferase family 9 protein [Chryseosolibacter indicus]|uniref:Glycosyltransferase family 9 protein n=1 Tax=Chryseosolibacter indicus TaxID=2782351 RepID=A0ABS5VKC5_9BACT|nr:glycosyltransferase family 9 protein [Chryseosolibacter indicus]MBT1701895.1 glycosyltransferase family 9 protein [Chryseosolibacter indicus]
MNVIKKINVFRGKVLRKLTRNIGSSHLNRRFDLKEEIEIKKILVCRPNHRLGNLLLITPLLQDIADTLPEARVDLFVKGSSARTIFKNYDNINNIIQLPRKPFKNIIDYMKGWLSLAINRYDIVINVVNHSSSGRLSTQYANAKFKFFGDINSDITSQYPDYQHMAKYPVYSFRYHLSKLNINASRKPVANLDLKLTIAEIENGRKLLNNLINNNRRTICIFTYATGSKCYSQAWWEEVYNRLKTEYKDFNIIEILPVENISLIGFKAPSFYSKDIREIGSLIANTEVFLGADSGMMHLASAVHTPTIGLFKVSKENTYKPYNNKSTSINTTKENHLEECIQTINNILQPTAHV